MALAVVGLLAAPGPRRAEACTSFIVTRGATVDGSTTITYSADSHELYGDLPLRAAARHPPGAKREILDWDSGRRLGEIDQVSATYAVLGNMNEHQLVIAESTWGGREELRDPRGILDYGSLITIALERARTAREAIRVMTELVGKYGYASSGETFSIADPNEAWLLELVGKGRWERGAVWVARRVPDGYVTGHANAPRIRELPKAPASDLLAAPDVIAFARARGWFTGTDAEFAFADVYSPVDFGARRFCDARVWSMFRRAAPTAKLDTAWIEGADASAKPLPLWIRPDKKLSVGDVMGLMRDHFEGTALDMSKDVGAGPSRLPYRWRPLTWKLDGKEYFNERATSTQQTAFSFVSQSRGWLPGAIGGVLWFGVDDTASTVYFPMYAGAQAVPAPFAVGSGSFREVSWSSAFWVFNQVSNFAYLRYEDMSRDIRTAQGELESRFIAEQAEVDAAASALFAQAPRLARDYLTRYSVEAGEEVTERWKALSKHLLLKYLDGNVKDEHGRVKHPLPDERWRREVIKDTGERLLVRPSDWERAQQRRDQERLVALRGAVEGLLRSRGIHLNEAQRRRLSGAEDRALLEKWLVDSATATSPDDALQDTTAQPAPH